MVWPLWKTGQWFLKKLSTEFITCTSHFTPKYIPKRNENSYSNKYMHMHIHSSTIHNSQKWKQYKCSPNVEWINKLWCIRTMGYYSDMKRNEVLIRATMWMNLKNIMVNERSQTQKVPYCVIPFICNIENR